MLQLLAEGLKVDFLQFVENLKYMGLGMLIIFIIIGIIILATVLLNKLFTKIKPKKPEEENT